MAEINSEARDWFMDIVFHRMPMGDAITMAMCLITQVGVLLCQHAMDLSKSEGVLPIIKRPQRMGEL